MQKAIDQAADGDTVLVPAGRSAWTKRVFISKTLVLKGAGIGRTIITDNKFTLGGGANALGVRTNRGVIWKNVFLGTRGASYANSASALRHKHGLTASWRTPAKWGADDAHGDQNLYFETNILTNALEGVDVDDNPIRRCHLQS